MQMKNGGLEDFLPTWIAPPIFGSVFPCKLSRDSSTSERNPNELISKIYTPIWPRTHSHSQYMLVHTEDLTFPHRKLAVWNLSFQNDV